MKAAMMTEEKCWPGRAKFSIEYRRPARYPDDFDPEEGEMKPSAWIDAASREDGHQESPVPPKACDGSIKDSMAFLKAFARAEGVCLNDSIWARIEETVASHAR
jgi:hypothetical protein